MRVNIVISSNENKGYKMVNLGGKISVIRIVFEFYPIKGGSVTHIMELSKKIHPYLKNQIIIAPYFNEECKEFDESFGIQVIRLKYQKFSFFQSFRIPITPLILLFYSYNAIKKVQELIKGGIGVDVIHVHAGLVGLFISFFNKLYRLRLPIVQMQHGNPAERSFRSLLSTELYYSLMYFMKPNHIILLDDGTRIEECITHFKKREIKFDTVYHGIDTLFFNRSKELKKSEYGFVILSTHRLVPVKRIEIGILAFKKFLELINNREEVRLVLIGNGECREDLINLTKQLSLSNKVEFLGDKNIEEVRDYLISSDIVIGTSLESNMNRSIQEAMACGKPVVVFDSGGTNKLIKHLYNGLLVESGNVQDFAEKLFLLYENQELRKKIGVNARKFIEENRSWDTRINIELKIYEKVILEKNKNGC